MGWGDTFSDAWNAASDTARAGANAIADTATSTYNAVVDARNKAIDRAVDTVTGIIDYVVDARDRAINRVLDRVISGFQAIYDAFGRLISGGAVQPCPHGGRGGGTTPPRRRETPPPPPPPPPPVDDYNIVSVDWLNGDDTTVIGACDQFVNLPRDAKWRADRRIANSDRLSSSPRLLVKSDKPISACFR